MTTKINVLHITAHLGGGVGKVLSGLSIQSHVSNSDFNHIIVCLEKPIKIQNINKIINSKTQLIIKPTVTQLTTLIENSDIVQLEWWNHETMNKYLENINAAHIRLVTWYHQSGLNSSLPQHLILNSHVFLFTSDCSFANKEVSKISNKTNTNNNTNIGTVYSSGGFEDFPYQPDIQTKDTKKISVGYFGAIKFQKLHPEYVNYISKINIPNFKVIMIGDTSDKKTVECLKKQCESIQRPNLLEFTGYVNNPFIELGKVNVHAYLLNPEHYGTAENSLLESMAMGIVPIVLNNPAEKCIVDNNVTGFIVKSPDEFADTINYLYNNPSIRKNIGEMASKSVREKFSIEKTQKQLDEHYKKVMQLEKRTIDFKKISIQN